jgi:hypothetical protein
MRSTFVRTCARCCVRASIASLNPRVCPARHRLAVNRSRTNSGLPRTVEPWPPAGGLARPHSAMPARPSRGACGCPGIHARPRCSRARFRCQRTSPWVWLRAPCVLRLPLSEEPALLEKRDVDRLSALRTSGCLACCVSWSTEGGAATGTVELDEMLAGHVSSPVLSGRSDGRALPARLSGSAELQVRSGAAPITLHMARRVPVNDRPRPRERGGQQRAGRGSAHHGRADRSSGIW